MHEPTQRWSSNSFSDDCTGRGRPAVSCVNIPSFHTSYSTFVPSEISDTQFSLESSPELMPPSVTSSSDDESEELHMPNTTKSTTTKSRKVHHLRIVCPPVELPLKLDGKPMQITLVPCLQFLSIHPLVNELTVEFWRRYQKMSVSFSQKEIGFFSTADRADPTRCREDDRYLKRLIYPLEHTQVHFDLNVGAEYLDAKEPPACLDSILWWIIRHRHELFMDEKFSVDFVCWRGTLRKIMSSLFESNVDWRVGIIRWRGCHFMRVFHTETEVKIEAERTPIEKRLQYWGHKFEDYITADHVPLVPAPKKIFSSVHKATAGRHTLLYSCEIDACTSNSTRLGDQLEGTYVEVKTTYAKHLSDLNFAFSRKYAKWWQQCFLAGIDHMLLGFRDHYGIVQCLQPLTVAEIENRAETWSANAFLAFLDEFCSFVRRTITSDSDIYLFYYSPKEKKIKCRVSDEPQYQFIPHWFLAAFS